MAATKQLREKRANAWAQAQEFLNRTKAGEDLSAEDQAAWERSLADIDSLDAEATRLERSEALEQRFAAIDEDTAVVRGNGSVGSVDEYREAFTGYLRHGMTGISESQRSMLEANFRDQSAGTNSEGGYTVPTGFWAKVTETLKAYASVASIADVLATDAGNNIPWPTNDDTSNEGELLGENTAATNPGDLVFGQKTLVAYMYSSKIIPVSRQLLQDAGADIEAFVAKKIGERLGRITNRHFTVGTGTAQPQGFVAGATTGVTGTTGQTTTVTYDDLVDLIHSVDAAYRAAGRCRFAMHDLSIAKIRKIKDSDGRPIWEPSVQAGVPDTLLGYGLTANNSMATMAANAKSVAFGDFASALVVRQVKGGEVLRLSERAAEKLQVWFLGFGRFDSKVQDSSAVKLYVNSAT
jgi:HK97 family phage major capsid protein